MEIAFYDTRVDLDSRITLVKEKTVECPVNSIERACQASYMINSVTGLCLFAEEHCFFVALNTKGKPLGVFFVAKGAVNQCYIGMREIFLRALLIGAVNIIFFHNHPMGDCTPSKADIELTDTLRKAGELLSIPLIDHIIVDRMQDYYSFKEHGML